MRLRRVFVWLTVAAVMAAAYLLYEPPTPARTQPTAPINLTGEVESSMCGACHLRIAEARKPGLIFDHGNHLMIACASCHYAMPHHDGKTDIPSMQACFNCHGISHGPQGQLARRDCPACHTATWNLRPADHTKNYAAKPHATQSKSQGVNDCLMCHTASKDCDPCHVKQNVRLASGQPIGPMPKQYVPIAPILPKKVPVVIDPTKTVTMSQCVYCHPNLDAFDKTSVSFNHDVHLKRGYLCTVCHPAFAHGDEMISRPPMQTCYQCHGMVHASNGLVATDACAKCHPKTFALEPGNHTPAFIAGGHKARAGADVAYCSMCHKPDFCILCHQGRKKLANGEYSQVALPDSHKKGGWLQKHGTLFLEQKDACGACHDSPSCQTCHYTPMPHPTDWITGHGKVARAIPEDKRDCNVCHTDRETCQKCHHEGVKSAELRPENCVRCHPVMSQQPATAIKDQGMAEHAVHFAAVKKYKGQYYKCNDCHVGFGTGANGQGTLSQAGHDVQVCYGCHGKLDYQNELIAPWPGAQLCVRCHPDRAF